MEIRTRILFIKNKNKILPLEIGHTNFSPFIKKYFAKYVDCLRLPDISSERLCKQQLNSSLNSFSFIALFLYTTFPEWLLSPFNEISIITSWCKKADEYFFQPKIIIVLELIFEWSRRFANDTFSVSNLVYARFQYIHFLVQNKFYAIHTNFLPAVLNSTSVRLRYSNSLGRNPRKR